METKSVCFETGESLAKLKGAILSHWEELVRQVITNSKHEQSIILLNHIPELLDQLINILRNAEVNEVQIGKSHGFHRAVLTNFSIADMLTEYALLRETLIDYLYPIGSVNCAKLIHKFLDILSKHSAIEFTNDLSMRKSMGGPSEHVHTGNEVQEIKDNPVIDTH